MSRESNDQSESIDPRAKRRQWEREHYRKDPQKALERVRRYQATEKGKAAAKRARARDNATYKARMERYRAQATENNRRWYYRDLERSRDIKRVAAIRRRDREQKAAGHASSEQLLARAAYWGWRCWICRGEWVTFDHVKPLAAGGSHWPSNRRPICRHCNEKKGATWPFVV